MGDTPLTQPTDISVANYCVSFIDLLGQREALRGQTLIPVTESEEDKQKLYQTLRASIGSIAALQERADVMLTATMPNSASPLRAQLPADQQVIWDEMQRTKITTQRWSDGLVSFASLGNQNIQCHMNCVYRLFALAGTLCFIGLADKCPIRGAIEIAWAVELHPGELYGAAIARAYELESQVANYPRIVIGPEAIKYIKLQTENPYLDPFSRNNCELAKLCLGMVTQDADGHFLLHYLGNSFREAVSKNQHAGLYADAYKFVLAQQAEHQTKKNTKLAFRYLHLLRYFNAHPVQA